MLGAHDTQVNDPRVAVGPLTWFCANTVTIPASGISIRYCVLTPPNETSIIRPGPSTLCPVGIVDWIV